MGTQGWYCCAKLVTVGYKTRLTRYYFTLPSTSPLFISLSQVLSRLQSGMSWT